MRVTASYIDEPEFERPALELVPETPEESLALRAAVRGVPDALIVNGPYLESFLVGLHLVRRPSW